jgi:hypothetical protein
MAVMHAETMAAAHDDHENNEVASSGALWETAKSPI